MSGELLGPFNFTKEDAEKEFPGFCQRNIPFDGILEGSRRIVYIVEEGLACIALHSNNVFVYATEEGKRFERDLRYRAERLFFRLNPLELDNPHFLPSQILTFVAGKGKRFSLSGYRVDDMVAGKALRDQNTFLVKKDSPDSETGLLMVRQGLGRLNLTFSDRNLIKRIVYVPYRYHEDHYSEEDDNSLDIEGRPSIIEEFEPGEYNTENGETRYETYGDDDSFQALIYDEEGKPPVKLFIPTRCDLLDRVATYVGEELIKDPMMRSLEFDRRWREADITGRTGIIWRRG